MAHNAHARAPDHLRTTFKKWLKAPSELLDTDPDIIRTESLAEDCRLRECEVPDISLQRVNMACKVFLECGQSLNYISCLRCFEIKALPGLFIYPSLLPVEVQTALLNKLVHRDLSDPNHKTNLHLHYHMPATSTENGKAASFFDLDHSLTVQPKDPNIHKPISVTQMLEKKLRWVTLGGQYDWTQKVYPKGDQPEFPSDVAELLQGFFPSVDPQAAILNLYSPGDTLSLHRDVSEECDRGLISLSIGCDAIFLAANSDGSEMATIRLCSGDALLMSGKSRFAWHAVPKVLPGTCPKIIQPWPANSVGFAHEQWRGWLTNKRINLNVRQMRDGTAPSQDVPIDS